MALFSRIKIWVSGEVLYAADLNNEFNNLLAGFNPLKIESASSTLAAMQTTVDPAYGGTPSLAPDLLGEIQRLRFQAKAITGKANWYTPPVTTIESLNTRVANVENSAVTTNGTDPGRYGVSSVNFGKTASFTGTVGTPFSSIINLGTVTLATTANALVTVGTTKRIGTTITVDAGDPTIITQSSVGGFQLSMVFNGINSNAIDNIFFAFNLYKNGTLYDRQVFRVPFSHSAFRPPVNFNFSGGPANAFVGSPANITGSDFVISGFSSGSANALSGGTIDYVLPYSAYTFSDFSVTGLSPIPQVNTYNVTADIRVNPSGFGPYYGSFGGSVGYFGTLYAKEGI